MESLAVSVILIKILYIAAVVMKLSGYVTEAYYTLGAAAILCLSVLVETWIISKQPIE